MQFVITVIAFIVVFGLLVFVHEFGHFLAAKWMDVKVNSFAFGFPPTIWSKKIGETTYKVNAIPLGGYVSLQGELETEEEQTEDRDPRSLTNKQPWQVIVILIAGVTMNMTLSIVLFWLAFMVGFQPILGKIPQYKGINNTMNVSIDSVQKDSPAEKAGLLTGDKILKIDGKDIQTDSELINELSANTSVDPKEVALTVARGSEIIEKKMVPAKSKIKLKNGSETDVVRIGVVLITTGKVQGGVMASFGAAFSEVTRLTALTFESVIGLFKQLIFQFKISEDVSGPVGIVVLTDYFAKLGIMPLVQFAGVLSLSLAIFNILPIPALDGGQIMVTTVEMIIRKKLSGRIKNTIQIIGFGLIIGLFLVITVKDFVNFGIINFITGLFR